MMTSYPMEAYLDICTYTSGATSTLPTPVFPDRWTGLRRNALFSTRFQEAIARASVTGTVMESSSR